MLSNAKDIIKKMKLDETERMKDIYDGCAEAGLQKRFADAFYYRITEVPLAHTKNVIENGGDIKSLKVYLQILLDKRPDDKKANEWKQSLNCILENKYLDPAQVSAEEKIAVYETQIEDMLHVFQERLCELEQCADLSDFQQGRKLAYQEITEIINTRYEMIWDVLYG